MNNYYNHAMREFRAAGWINEQGLYSDEMQEQMCNHMVSLLDVFGKEEHSGFSASYAIKLFSKLAKFDPIIPLTGEYWEWNLVSDGGDGKMYQNNRCGAVFKSTSRFGGQPYYMDGKVFWEWHKNEDGEIVKVYSSGSDSHVPITFPYTPKTEYVFKPTEKYPNEDPTK